MTIDVSPTTPTPSHHISLEDANGNKYGLILYPTARSVQRRPKQSSQYTPFTQSDWSGGRGLKFAESDPSRYADSKRLITRRIGDVMLAGQETYSTGYRAAEQFMPADSAGLSWQALTGGNRFAAFKLTASVTSNRAKLYFWVRRRGTPNGAFEARLKNDNAGDPGSQLRLVSATTSDIDDTISLLYEFTFVSVQAVTNGVNYWVEAAGASGDDATNHWEVGVDAARSQALTKASPTAANGTWVNTTYDLFYRLVDDTSILGALKFIYKGQTYMVTRPANAGTPKLYMNGYRGVATGTQSTTTLQDTTQAWAVNELAGKLLFFVDGSASELSRPYVTITGNTNNTITFPQIGAAPVTAKTAYVILGLNKWIEITGHGLTTVTDVADMGEVLYFAQGDSVVMRRMHEYNLGGVWTREFADEDNYAKLLKIWRHPTRGLMILKANDYDNSNRPSVAMAPSMPWGSRLSFPWLLDACEATTNWTFLTGVTGSLDTSIYKTGSGSIKMQVTGSPTLLGYRKWTAGISLKNQKRIRLWVLSNTTLDKGDLKLRISAATDCSSAIQTLDIPVLNANEWTQIELAFKDHDQASIGKVKSIGFVKSSSVGTIWVDGLETLPGESEVLLGSDLERVTGLELYGDPSVPWVFRTKSIGSIENGTFNPIPIREYEQVENIHNGQAHVVFDVYLFFSFLQGVESYYRNNLDDVGPNRDEGLPNNRQGYIVSMVGYPGRFYVACDGGPNGYSSIFEFKGGGYHEVYRCDAKGKS
ncbi:MAG TPA: hypothetical protein VHM28_05875, partial [Anaerolineales bacterium]|nr:hypothetical protein [Anaerolineales bacterium]